MNRLLSDPQIEICPDFTSAFYQTSRAPLVAANNTEDQAANLLQAVWVATNAAQQLQWQAQVALDQAAEADRQRLIDQENDHLLQAQRLADATVEEEEKKKNRLKHIPIPKRPRPSRASENILVSDFALRKLDKGHFVEIYYWTNKGLADARFSYRAADDEGMVPTKTSDGATAWIPANATRPSSTVVPDCSLEPLDFAQAIPRLVASLTERGWNHERVHMLAGFWGALMLHRYWSLDDPLDRRALLMYQEEQRRAWHQAIPLPDGAWDISILDDVEISRTLDRLYREDRRRKDQDFDYQVSMIQLVCLSIH
ncbi:uncharacterized protein F5891DRAFT_966538 [Suillus fuscotomentosus]|uniref:Uncharacterized protein n=1 Tax=Suillus fuscotomentosus TaxID=1912939 RepID=A0AAD4HBF1_9AGAM|nr:uncharacterized protein F5891DRAFT_966538 [Suillus fuscotomentosus]KAG1887920.1 hypothetical protein F5891DRAFT_966538 [Suillus fuscotomentosus]